MFSLADIPEYYEWDLTVYLPHKNRKRRFILPAYLRLMDQDRVDEIRRLVDEADKEGAEVDQDICMELLYGWDETKVVDEDGTTPLEVTEANRRKLTRVLPIRKAIIAGWHESMEGKMAARKNE